MIVGGKSNCFKMDNLLDGDFISAPEYLDRSATKCYRWPGVEN